MYPNHGFSSTLSPSLQSLQGLRVLVVDNNVDSCTLLSLLLQPYGVEVRTAQLAKQAFMLCMHWQPDVIVSDIALPEENGIALIQQVRAQEPGKNGFLPLLSPDMSAKRFAKMRSLIFGLPNR
jgi:two-component system OmpR family response regulator